MEKESKRAMKVFVKVIVLIFAIGSPVIVFGILFTSTQPGCPFGTGPSEEFTWLIIALVLLLLFSVLVHVFYKVTLRAKSKVLVRVMFFFMFFMIVLGSSAQVYGVIKWSDKISEKVVRDRYVSFNVARVIHESSDYNAFPRVYRLQNGSLWAVWYRGDGHVDSNNDGKLLQSFSSDDGLTWSTPVVIHDDPYLDTRNPGLGQLSNGTLIVQAYLYNGNGSASLATRCDWIQSDDGGKTWSSGKDITPAEINPAGETLVSLVSPFGNMFKWGSHELMAVYGGGNIILIEFNYSTNSWQYFSTPFNSTSSSKAAGRQVSFYEADVDIIDGIWLSVARSNEDRLYYSYSNDGLVWSEPVPTSYRLGHSPDVLVLGNSSEPGLKDLFFVNRGDKGLLRGGLAHFNVVTREFSCEDVVLYAALGSGGANFGYASSVLLNSTTVGFIDYDVIICESLAGEKSMRGMITWQTWEWSP
ncbi:MAG: sialidase family protein [Promethearchaeota archaeon]